MKVPETIKQRIQGIKCLLCLGHIPSAIALMHCLIEEMGYLSMSDGKDSNGAKEYFAFVDTHILPHLKKKTMCTPKEGMQAIYTPQELYLSRCGSVHSGKWIGKANKAPRILMWLYEDKKKSYSYGVSVEADTEVGNGICLPDLNDFWEALQKGIRGWFEKQTETALLESRLCHSIFYSRWRTVKARR